MKKLLAAALAALVLVSVPVAASIQVPRQVDPNAAPADQVYGQGLYLFYGAVVAALSGGNFSAARQLLHQTSFIHIPAEISDAVDSFDGLVNSTAVLFQTVNGELSNASALIATGRVALASTYLQEAISNLRGANQTLAQLFGAEPQLASLTGIPSSLLLQRLQPLETVYKADSSEAARLVSIITGLTKLELPAVTLAVAQKTIETGSNVTVSGRLATPSGSPIPSRAVAFYFANRSMGQATTDQMGDYAATLRTPYYYVRTASVFASFVPAGNDTLLYSPAVSADVLLNVTFSTPVLSLVQPLGPARAYAGVPFRVNGSLSLGGLPLSGYNVTIAGLSSGASALTSSGGTFSLRVSPPASLAQGTYPLTLKSGANRTVGPLASSLQVLLVKEYSTVTASIPVIAFAGFPITVSGSATANGTGLSAARVLGTTPSPSVNTTTKGGSFTFTQTPPLTSTKGDWSYTSEVYPSQSWIAPAAVSVRVFVVNPLVLAFPVASVVLLAVVVRRRRPPASVVRTAAPEPVPGAPSEPPPRPPLTGIPAIYYAAAELVAKATSIPLLPQMTVREYLALVRGKAKGQSHFEYISSALESHLYGTGVYREVEEWEERELKLLRGELEG